MKKVFLYLIFTSVAFYACENKDESLFEESADARLNAALASYEKQLVEAPNGWNAVIYPGGGGSYGFFLKFNDQNRVVMYSDFTEESAGRAKESSYRLKAMQTPSLIFDTYSYLHVLSDPDNRVNNGVVGEGLQSDFEFSIFPDSLTADRLTFVGRKNQSRLVLTRATAAQETAYANGDLAKAVLFNNISKIETYFKRMTVGGETYELTVSPAERLIKFTWLDGTTPRTFTTGYYFAGSSLVLLRPLVNGSQTINSFSNFTWNANSLLLRFSAGGANTSVQPAIKPLVVDAAIARRWWQTPIESGGYWESFYGFQKVGVDDALGVRELEYEGGYFHRYMYQPGANARYDIFAPLFVIDNTLTLVYAHAPGVPRFVSDGRIIFSPQAVLGPVPASGPVVNSANVLYDAAGFYLVQISETSYDMVSAKDAKTWINWF